jgi:hypothetical protein
MIPINNVTYTSNTVAALANDRFNAPRKNPKVVTLDHAHTTSKLAGINHPFITGQREICFVGMNKQLPAIANNHKNHGPWPMKKRSIALAVVNRRRAKTRTRQAIIKSCKSGTKLQKSMPSRTRSALSWPEVVKEERTDHERSKKRSPDRTPERTGISICFVQLLS